MQIAKILTKEAVQYGGEASVLENVIEVNANDKELVTFKHNEGRSILMLAKDRIYSVIIDTIEETEEVQTEETQGE